MNGYPDDGSCKPGKYVHEDELKKAENKNKIMRKAIEDCLYEETISHEINCILLDCLDKVNNVRPD